MLAHNLNIEFKNIDLKLKAAELGDKRYADQAQELKISLICLRS